MAHLTEDDRRVWRSWADAAGEAAVDHALRDLYDRLVDDIAGRSPTCWLSGKCCKFESYGHRLYVTGLEIAWMLGQIDADARARLDAAELRGMDGCPFQMSKMCGVHAIRPLGCRIYYCDPAAKSWQNEVYEQYQNELRRLHDQRGLTYRYMEWRMGLEDARAAMGGAANG
ncbi:MAG: hypothetical protein GC162_09830 [Planctomycetes bacterium]|nr:hypothetical protein [Planctomycetota bacterium]